MFKSNLYLFKYFLLIFILCNIEGNKTESTTEASEVISSTTNNDEITDSTEEMITTESTNNEEAQLPIDLLSHDVLLDPNVVLARLSRRDLRDIRKREPVDDHYRGYNDWRYKHQEFIRRQSNKFDKTPNRKREIPKKMKIYPVFPGK